MNQTHEITVFTAAKTNFSQLQRQDPFGDFRSFIIRPAKGYKRNLGHTKSRSLLQKAGILLPPKNDVTAQNRYAVSDCAYLAKASTTILRQVTHVKASL